MKVNKRSIWSWALYDWANSAYATTVMAGFFPLFFKEYWSDPNNPNQSTFYLGMANSLYAIVVAALAPFLGAIADQGSKKKKFLIFFAFSRSNCRSRFQKEKVSYLFFLFRINHDRGIMDSQSGALADGGTILYTGNDWLC